jgi:arylsulfatase
MSFDFGGRPAVQLPENLAHAVVTKPPADVPVYQRQWDIELPANLRDDLSGAAPAVREYAAMMDTAFGPVADDLHWHAALNFYLNCIRDVDRSVESVLDALVASGQADNTVIIFTADHGDLVASHGLRQKGNLVYDENFHVPLIISHPDARGGGESTALASAVDLAPTILQFAGLDGDAIAEQYPALHGHSLVPALDGGTVRAGVLTAVEAVTYLDAGFWGHFADPDVADRILSGDLRPDWRNRGFLRGYTDEQYTFGRYFSPLEPNRPGDVDTLFAHNDVVLYDRYADRGEVTNLASAPDQRNLVDALNAKLEGLDTDEIGDDTRAWVAERPQLLGWPTWKGDTAA